MSIKFDLKLLTFFILLCFGLSVTPRAVTNLDKAIVPVFKVDANQLQCMAKNIFYEAGGESLKGQAAVARVVLNRVSHGFAKTPCGVIYQATVTENGKVCQFSWVCEGKNEPNKNSYRYLVAKEVAYKVMVEDQYKDVVPNSVLFFHNLSVTPIWPYAEAIKIGNHIFYSKGKKKIKLNKKLESA